MKYLVIEDEEPAAVRLEKMIRTISPNSEKLAHLVSIKSSVEWLKINNHPDLIFMDIQLADGNSFEIFKHIQPQCPVIFVTAYDQFAIAAFKVNSIDYLLKPVKAAELAAAIERFNLRKSEPKQGSKDMDALMSFIKAKSDFKKRILIRFGDVIKAVEVNDVAYFYTESKINFLTTFSNLNYPIDQNLDQLEAILDPAIFFRINRQFIVNVNAILKMVSYSKSRVKLDLKPATEIETIVSTERSPNFKNWLTGSTHE
jgi:DNA-binding LytR/AlgR family response regulator